MKFAFLVLVALTIVGCGAETTAKSKAEAATSDEDLSDMFLGKNSELGILRRGIKACHKLRLYGRCWGGTGVLPPGYVFQNLDLNVPKEEQKKIQPIPLTHEETVDYELARTIFVLRLAGGKE